MKTSKVVLLCALLAGLICLCALLLFSNPEPAYQRKPISQWVQGLEYLNANPTDEQRAALRAMGEPAVTWLSARLQHRDSNAKKLILNYARHHPAFYNWFIVRERIVPESTYHAQAATALGEIGPPARSAIPALTVAAGFKDSLTAARARAALIKIREEPVDELVAQLADTHSTNWFRTALTIKYLGTNGQAAVPFLINGLQNANAGTRQYSVWALQGIASRPDLTVPALIPCLNDTNAGVRRSTIDALCQFKEARAQTVPLILARMQDSNLNVWLGAAFGLEKLLTPDEIQTLYVPALRDSLTNPNPIIALNAKTFLTHSVVTTAKK